MTSHKNNSFDDIIPPGGNPSPKRSIRDIPIPEKKQNKIDELLKETEDFRSEHQHPAPEERAKQVEHIIEKEEGAIYATPSSNRLWIGILAAILIIAAGALFFFRGADVTISLKTESIPVDIIATSAAEGSAATSTLAYKVLPLQKTATKDVAATGPSTKVEKKASGTIIIYNNYNAESQQLVATTRFETSDGKVYRIDKPVTVPGTSIANGQTVPGSVEAVVYADQTGPSYNIDRADFTIPGFKGSAKYEGFYARSKTALAGGYSGTMPQVSDADLKAANDELQATLTAQAMAALEADKPAGYSVFKEGIRTAYSSDVTPGTDGKAKVTGKVDVEALIFEQADIEELIADSRSGEKYHFDNLDSLALTIQNQANVTSYISSPVLSIRLAGTLVTGQSFDEEALKRALSDKSKSQLQEILRMYPEITKAEATLRPFWSRSFPENPDKIDIIVTKEQ